MIPDTMRLVVEDEAGTRSTVPFTGDEIVIGRATEGVTVRLSDRDVSRRHARFLLANGAVHVEDLGSLTGTRVNGERITGRRRLREGDLVQIGDYDLALFGEAGVSAPGAPPPLPPTPRPSTGASTGTPPPPSAPQPAPPTPAAPVAASAPTPARAPVPRPASEPVRAASGGPGAIVWRALLAGLLALALGAAAGYAVGIATAPADQAALTRP